MKNSFMVLMLLAATGTATGPAFSETVTFACRYDAYTNEKGLHNVQEDFRLVFAVDTEKRPPRSSAIKARSTSTCCIPPTAG